MASAIFSTELCTIQFELCTFQNKRFDKLRFKAQLKLFFNFRTVKDVMD